MYALIALIAVTTALALALAASVYRNVQLLEKIDEIGEQVDQSLEVLDYSYNRIARVLEIPVASDEPYVRELLSDVRAASNAVLLVANKIVSFDDDEEATGDESGR